MSAILGLWQRDGSPVEHRVIDQAFKALAHRCHHGQALWCAGELGLAHSTPNQARGGHAEEASSIPPTRSSAIVFTGRLDNREELLHTLVQAGDGIPGSCTDDALAFACFRRWGADCAERLLGDFSFAIWDGANRRWFCARDPMGVRPFFYAVTPLRFAFASEIKALLQLPGLDRRINERRVLDHLSEGLSSDPEATFYEGIRRLPAGHALTVTTDRTELRDYWRLDPAVELSLPTNDDYAAAFRTQFTESVRCRLEGPKPLGAMLSGGLDSSSITCVARNLLRESGNGPVHAFSAVFPGLPEDRRRVIDESPWIDAVACSGHIISHKLEADRLAPWQELDPMLRQEDEPFFGPNLYLHWGLHRLAHEKGVHVLLDGIDGDTTVGHGLDWLADLAVEGRWIQLYREAAAIARRRHTRGVSPWHIIRQCALGPLVPGPLMSAARRLRGRSRGESAHESVVDPSFEKRMGLDRPEGSQGGRRRGNLRERAIGALRSPLMTQVLELADRSAAVWGVEPRYPFFDRRLIEFCLSLPASQRLSNGWTRIVQRRGMSGILPAEVCWRFLKSNLSPNFLHTVRERELPRLASDARVRQWEVWRYMSRPTVEEALRRSSSAGALSSGRPVSDSQDGCSQPLAADRVCVDR